MSRQNMDTQERAIGGSWQSFCGTLRRDLLIAFRQRSDAAQPLLFFLMVVVLLPLGLGPEAAVLGPLAPGLIWVLALLATLLSLESVFRADFEDGSLEQMLLSPQSLYFQVLAKVFVHWLVTGVPLTLLAPLLAVMLSLPGGHFSLLVSLALGTASLSLLGAIGAALTVSLRRGGLLVSLIILPMYVPILIFGTSAVTTAMEGYSNAGQLAIMGAFLALALALAPLAAAGALRVGVKT